MLHSQMCILKITEGFDNFWVKSVFWSVDEAKKMIMDVFNVSVAVTLKFNAISLIGCFELLDRDGTFIVLLEDMGYE